MKVRLVRRMLAGLAAALLGLFVSVTVASTAQANSAYLNAGPSGSWGYAEWYASTGNLRLISQPTSMAGGWCLSRWHDWKRATSGHLDGNVSRSCLSSVQMDGGWNNQGVAVVAMQKAATCYGANNTLGSCTQDPNRTADIAGVIPGLPNQCTRSWIMSSGGVFNYNSAGSPTSCDS